MRAVGIPVLEWRRDATDCQSRRFSGAERFSSGDDGVANSPSRACDSMRPVHHPGEHSAKADSGVGWHKADGGVGQLCGKIFIRMMMGWQILPRACDSVFAVKYW